MASGRDTIRDLRIRLSLLGTQQTDKGLKKTSDGINELGKNTEVAAKQADTLADALLKSSEAADKKLKKVETLFAGSDRLAAILGKVTGAIGIGALAYKGITKVIEAFTNKQKNAALAVAAQTKRLKAQADAVRRLSQATGSFAGAVGVSPSDIPQQQLVQGAHLTEQATRLTQEYSDQVAEVARRQRLQDDLLRKMRPEQDRLQKMFQQRIATREEMAKAAAIQEEIKKGEAFVQAANKTALTFRKRLLDVEIKRFNLVGKTKQFLDPVGGTPGDIKDPGPAATTQAAARMVNPITQAVDAALIAGAQRFEGKLVSLFAQLRNPLPQLSANGERATKVFDTLGASFSKFAPMVDGLTRSLSPFVDKLGETAVAFRQVVGEARTMQEFRGTLSKFASAGADSLLQAGVAAAFYGESIKKALGQSMQALGIESVVQALKSTALGIGALATGNPKAPLFFKQAATWTAVGAAAGVAGAALGANSGGGGGGAAGPARAPTRRDLPPDRGEGGTNVTINMDLKMLARGDERQFEDTITRAVTNGMRRRGGHGRAFRREVFR